MGEVNLLLFEDPKSFSQCAGLVISFIFLASSAFGQVIASDRGGFGEWIRGERPIRLRPEPSAPTPSE